MALFTQSGTLIFSVLVCCVVWCSLSDADLLPGNFKCTNTITSKKAYSTPKNNIEVDYVHVLCGQRSYGDVPIAGSSPKRYKKGYKATGFHARPGNIDPESASVEKAVLTKRPQNKYDFTSYKGVIIRYKKTNYTKQGKTTLWPSIMTAEDIIATVVYLTHRCLYDKYSSIILADRNRN